MKRGIEKSANVLDDKKPQDALFDILSLVSIVAALAGASVAIAGQSWRVGAYFTLVAALFDIVLAYEFFARLASGRRPIPWLYGLSSIVPLLAVSGPFLFGWTALDLSSAAVRGFWLAPPPLGGLTVAGALRLLRVARPFLRPGALSRSEGRAFALAIAAAAGVSVALLGALASGTLLLPGSAKATSERRTLAISSIAAASGDAERVLAAEASGAVALTADGRVLLSAKTGISPSEYAHESRGAIEAWFSTERDIRSRAVTEAVAMLACLAAAAAYWMAMRAVGGHGGPAEPGDGQRARLADRRLASRRLADAPTGDEELAGILGKRSRQ